MATITDVKAKALDKLYAMDLENVSLMDVSMYVDILHRLSDIGEKSYMETLVETMEKSFGKNQPAAELPTTGCVLGGVGSV